MLCGFQYCEGRCPCLGPAVASCGAQAELSVVGSGPSPWNNHAVHMSTALHCNISKDVESLCGSLSVSTLFQLFFFFLFKLSRIDLHVTNSPDGITHGKENALPLMQ